MSGEPQRDKSQQTTESLRLPGADEPPLHHFEVLAAGGKEALILHNEQVYRLRATKNGKLILNK